MEGARGVTRAPCTSKDLCTGEDSSPARRYATHLGSVMGSLWGRDETAGDRMVALLRDDFRGSEPPGRAMPWP